MEALKRLLLALLILIAGLGIAWIYRIDPDATDEEVEGAVIAQDGDADGVEVRQDPRTRLQGVPLPTPFDPRAAMPPAPVVAPPPRVEPPQMSTLYEAARVPPPLPPALDRVSEKPDSRPAPAELTGKDFTNVSRPPVLPPHLTKPPPPANRTPAPPAKPVERQYRVHTIANGDTLRRIARRYLGNADRYLEIYDLNLGVLRNPEVLPIGQQIKLPSKEAPAQASGLAAGQQSALQEKSGVPRLVPLPPHAFPRP